MSDDYPPGTPDREIAIRRRVHRIAEFYRHLLVYVIVISLVWILNVIVISTSTRLVRWSSLVGDLADAGLGHRRACARHHGAAGLALLFAGGKIARSRNSWKRSASERTRACGRGAARRPGPPGGPLQRARKRVRDMRPFCAPHRCTRSSSRHSGSST
ncbi:MAG: 2TM domain-containing protein [Betaproteobacteria bacterium]|nr:2TM domain-containing protein [Betaproteobacteria bacterium]